VDRYEHEEVPGMKTQQELKDLAREILAAWNGQDPDQVVAMYTEDVTYRDPNTRGAVEGADALRRYLSKLFSRWEMHWELREDPLPHASGEGVTALWRASFRLPGGERTAEAEGMDLVVLDGDRIRHNEVWFDRAALAPLLAPAAA
jgi:ketosteroid isomerase-like protein